MWNELPSLVTLPAVLEEEEPVVEQLVDRRTGDDSDDPAHDAARPEVVKGQS
jgi:hypothetical protein